MGATLVFVISFGASAAARFALGTAAALFSLAVLYLSLGRGLSFFGEDDVSAPRSGSNSFP